MTTIGNVLTSAQKNFEINSQAEGGDLAATVSALNNIWSEFNNLNAENSTEATRSVLLAAMDVYDIFSKSTNRNMVNNGIRVVALVDRFRINLEAFYKAFQPDSDTYDNGYVSKSLFLDIVADATAIFSSLAQFTKFSPIGVAVNVVSMFVTQISNSMNSLPDWNAKQKISENEIADFFMAATAYVLDNWVDTTVSIVEILANNLPDDMNPWVGNPIELKGTSDDDNIAEDINQKYTIFGNGGNDHITGGRFNDALYGGSGVDTLYGGVGNDYLDGGQDMDFLYGGIGQDRLDGGAGNDTLDGGEDDDILVDESGDDTYIFNGNFGHDTIYDMDGEGQIKINGTVLEVGEKINNKLWKSADGQYNIALLEDFDNVATSQKVVISKENENKNSITIKYWQEGYLGLTLNGTTNPNEDIENTSGIGNFNHEKEHFTTSQYLWSSWETVNGVERHINKSQNADLSKELLFIKTMTGYDRVDISDDHNYFISMGLISYGNNYKSINHVLTGNGNNILQGAIGADTLFTGSGNDEILTDDDIIYRLSDEQLQLSLNAYPTEKSEAWEKKLYNGIELDANGQIQANWSNFISSGAGNDRIFGGYGMDTVYAGADADLVLGGGGNDLIYGEQGADVLYGDSIIVQNITDLSYRFSWQAGITTRSNANYMAEVDLELATSPYRYNRPIENSPLWQNWAQFKSTINYADQGNDKIYGGAGNDVIFGQGGSDELYGGADNDIISGDRTYSIQLTDAKLQDYAQQHAEYYHQLDLKYQYQFSGQDKIYGGAGENKLFGGYKNDYIEGGEDNDIIYGDSDILAGFDLNQLLYVNRSWAEKNPNYFNYTTQVWNTSLNLSTRMEIYQLLKQQDPAFKIEADDELFGGGGHDKIYGEEGNDQISGGEGNDEIQGDHVSLDGSYHGDDILLGDEGDDKIWGQGGKDKIYGGSGKDYIEGDSASLDAQYHGDDTLYGDDGDDIIFGQGGADTIFGGADNDIIQGDAENLAGTSHGKDILHGDAGDDTLFGQGNDDEIYGGTGNDYIEGDSINLDAQYHGNDTLYGDEGDDTILGQGGNDTIFGGDGDDLLDGDANLLSGEYHGNDTIHGDAGNDKIWGQGGNDTIYGGTGNDYIEGDDRSLNSQYHGNDILHGDEGDDTIFGQGGNDQLYGGTGVDQLYGGDGDDQLYGGGGNDHLFGGKGSDRYYFSIGDGQDVIYEEVTDISSLNHQNFIYFDFSPEQVRQLSRDDFDLLIQYGTDDQVTVKDYYKIRNTSDYGYLEQQNLYENIEITAIHFANGTAWDTAAIMQKAPPPEQNEPIPEPLVGVPYFIDALVTRDYVPIQHNQGNDDFHTVVLYDFPENNGSSAIEFTYRQKMMVDIALALVTETTGVLFKRVQGTEKPDLKFYLDDLTENGAGDAAGYAIAHLGEAHLNSILFNTLDSLDQGTQGFELLLHEIGHVLGLKHPFEAPVLPEGENHQNQTLMSYTSNGVNDTNFQFYDIAALHYLYGVNPLVRSGNNSYGFADKYIWDGNGVDTFDASEQTDNVYIDLNAGSWIYTGQKQESILAQGQSFIGYGTTLENAITGSGDDTLVGNEYNNILQGGLGQDIYILNQNFGQDQIIEVDHHNILKLGFDLIEGQHYYYNGYLYVDNDSVKFNIEQFDKIYTHNTDITADFYQKFVLQGIDVDSELAANIKGAYIVSHLGVVLQANVLDNFIKGGEGNDCIDAGAGDDIILAGKGNDVLQGGTGNDILQGEDGVDTYLFNPNDGEDIIRDDGKSILILNNIFSEDIRMEKSEGILKVYYTNHDSITIENYQNQIEKIIFSDTVWDTQMVSEKIINIVYGTGQDDVLQGKDHVKEHIYALDGDDYILGNEGDVLYGGLGDDALTADGDSVQLRGGLGYDHYSITDGSKNILIQDDDFAGKINISGVPFYYLPLGSGEKLSPKTGFGQFLYKNNNQSYYKYTEYNERNAIFEYDATVGELKFILNKDSSNYLYNDIRTKYSSGDVVFYFKDLFSSQNLSHLLNFDVEIKTGNVYISSTGGTETRFVDTILTMQQFLNQGSVKLNYGPGDDIIYGLTSFNSARREDGLFYSYGEAAPTKGDMIYAGAGNDQIYTGLGESLVYGEDGDDYIVANDSLALDEIYGGAGDDIIYNYDPATQNQNTYALNKMDRLYGGDGHDSIYIKYQSAQAYGGNGNDKITGNGKLYGEDGDDILMGDGELYGGYGNDVITGNGILYGESGDDTVTGDGRLYGGDGNDIMTGNGVLYSEDGDGILTGNGELYGGSGNDTLIAGETGAYLDGGEGADILRGGAGDDIYVIDELDIIQTESDTGGYDTIIYTYEAAQVDLGNTSFEAVELSGSNNSNLYGNAADNHLIGNDGNNYIDGRTGSDFMAGGLGNDYYVVDVTDTVMTDEDGNTYIVEGDQVDEDFDGGIDTIERWQDARFIGRDANGNPILTNNHRLLENNIENLILKGNAKTAFGNELDNIIVGNEQDNYIDGLGGNDTYIFAKGGATDTYNFYDDIAATNILKIQGYSSSEVSAQKYGNSVYLSFKGTNDHIWLSNYYIADTANKTYRMDQIIFDSGTIWTSSDIDTLVNRAASNHAPTVNAAIPTINSNQGAIFSYKFASNVIIDQDSWDSLSYKITLTTKDSNGQYQPIPSWLNFDATTQTLSGTPPSGVTGNLTFFYWGTDMYGAGAGTSFTLKVNPPNQAPIVLNAIVDQSFTDAKAFSYTIPSTAFKDPDGDALTYTATLEDGSALPSWLTFNAATRVLSGTAPESTAPLNIKIIAKDTANQSVSDIFKVSFVVQNLTLSGTSSADTLYGGSGNDTITGLAGNDILYGQSGNDTLDGGAGNDTLYGGKGDDIYVVDSISDSVNENSSEGIDTVQSSVTYTLSNANVENLTLTGTSAISGMGNALNNILTGNSGNNTLTGGAGNDTLNGGAGTDTLIGGLGDDLYIIDSTTDTLTENTNEGTDTVQSSVTYTLGNNLENLILTGTSAINGTGNLLNNTITGNSAGNTLSGGTGADTLIGGLGDDIYVIDNTSDIVTENTSEGTDSVQSSVTYGLSANVENLTLTGTTAINGTGNALNNVLTGNSANNTLTGGAGNDTLNGGAGTDTLIGGLGDDLYVIDSTTDTLTENANEGADTVQSSVTYTLGNNIENLTLTGTTAINATGNALNNILIGNSAVNTLTGGAGDDYLDGGAGNDKLLGGLGNDTYVVDSTSDTITENTNEGIDTIRSSVTLTLGNNLENLTLTGTSAINGTGNALNNTLIGNTAINTLTGGAGDDYLDGGTGADKLLGGTGNDTYAVDNTSDVVTENANEGIDTVLSSITYTLGNNLENLTLTGSTAINATGNTLNNTLIGNNGANVLNSGAGNDILDGQGGNDQYTGGTGADTLVYNLLVASDVLGGNGSDSWSDFTIGNTTTNVNADKIDLSHLLIDYAGNHSVGSLLPYLNTIVSGSNTQLYIDRDGSGAVYSSSLLLTLNNTNTSLNDLINNHQIV